MYRNCSRVIKRDLEFSAVAAIVRYCLAVLLNSEAVSVSVSVSLSLCLSLFFFLMLFLFAGQSLSI